jgi:hypothetical protein
MLVRIKGKIEDILEQTGTSKEGKPWAKKTYVVRDTTYQKEEYNNIVHVQDFGKLKPDAFKPTFDNFEFKSNHFLDEEVDLACYLETNKFGFTNVNYGKPYADIDKPKDYAAPAVNTASEAAAQSNEEESGIILPF